MSSDDVSSLASIRPTLRRRGSDDSESSFKRKRSASLSNDPRHVRTSMRSSLREPSSSSPFGPAKRFSLRSLSPTGFRKNSCASPPPMTSSSMGGGSGFMRQSLRDGPTSCSSSRLKRGSFKKSPGLGIGRKARGAASRFADSSDEEDSGPTLFRSRFADSSDDEEPAPLPKSSNILSKSLRNGNGSTPNMLSRQVASPELPDDDDVLEQPRRGGALSKGRPVLQRSRSSRGTIEPLSPTRPASRRGSFMSLLRRKKGTSDKASKEVDESAAQTDTVLERSPEELARLRNSPLHELHEGGPSWPLPNMEGGTEAEKDTPREREPSRPSTAGAAGGAATTPKKSFFLRRRSTSQGFVGLGHPQVDASEAVPPIPAELTQTGSQQQSQSQPGKKKKFGALRKMFGIHD